MVRQSSPVSRRRPSVSHLPPVDPSMVSRVYARMKALNPGLRSYDEDTFRQACREVLPDNKAYTGKAFVDRQIALKVDVTRLFAEDREYREFKAGKATHEMLTERLNDDARSGSSYEESGIEGAAAAKAYREQLNKFTR